MKITLNDFLSEKVVSMDDIQYFNDLVLNNFEDSTIKELLMDIKKNAKSANLKNAEKFLNDYEKDSKRRIKSTHDAEELSDWIEEFDVF